LEAQIAQLQKVRAREVAERDEAIEKLRDELHTTKRLLAEEKKVRGEENTSSAATIKSLNGESARVRDELAATHREKKEEKQRLALQLADESADKAAKLAAQETAAKKEAAARKAEKEDSDGKLALLRAEMHDAIDEGARRYAALEKAKATSEAQLRAQLAQLTQEKAEGDEKRDEKYRKLEALKLQETTLLKSRVERLSKLQDAALNAGGAKARSLLYQESMKSKARQESSMSFRGETDPTGLPPEGEDPAWDRADRAPSPP